MVAAPAAPTQAASSVSTSFAEMDTLLSTLQQVSLLRYNSNLRSGSRRAARPDASRTDASSSASLKAIEDKLAQWAKIHASRPVPTPHGRHVARPFADTKAWSTPAGGALHVSMSTMLDGGRGHRSRRRAEI